MTRAWATMLTEHDLYLLHEGSHFRLYEKLGAHAHVVDGVPGTWFGVWAPNALRVSWIGDTNQWNPRETPMHPISPGAAVWGVFVPTVRAGVRYKFHIVSKFGGLDGDKADPFGFECEEPPSTASTVCNLDHRWGDDAWMASRRERQRRSSPISIYELHLGSWRRRDGRLPRYGEIAAPLIDHVRRLGFTHVELLPLMEHPFYGSWGYQVTGYFAPTRRYGEPRELMALIDALHRAGIGVILDWVPGHFPSDGHGLAFFDGTHLFEHADPRQGMHPEWGSLIFNFGRPEIRSFLISAARFWLDRYHMDGLRIDGVASMLYLDYARKPGEWVPNAQGGRENLDAVVFLRRLTDMVHSDFPDVITIAEDSTAWPMVTAPVASGGLGFDYKWDMGWMHDTLNYLKYDPIDRRLQHEKLTFRSLYHANESYVLPLSHDEVVHGKLSLLSRMPGDAWQKLANLRLLFANQWASIGKKLLFMGGEFGQFREWGHDRELDWQLAAEPGHAALMRYVAALNALYGSQAPLHTGDAEAWGFEWIHGSDADNSVVVWMRRGPQPDHVVLVVFNYTPIPRPDYWVGVPGPGAWEVLLESDAIEYGGSGITCGSELVADAHPVHGRAHRLRMSLAPLAAVFLRNRQALPPSDDGGPETKGDAKGRGSARRERKRRSGS
jgi:1,4-alpha-glucan branching enzyme